MVFNKADEDLLNEKRLVVLLKERNEGAFRVLAREYQGS